MDGIEPERGVGLGESQRALLLELKRLGEAGLAELDAAGLARETVRDHVKALQAAGLVERAGVRREGRGRPQVLYRLTDRGEELFPQREGELLGELAGFLLADGRHELLERFFTERNRARREHLVRRLDGLDGRERLAELAGAMSEEGFLAEVEGGSGDGPRLRLCHCPWRHLVEVSRLPCRAELNLVAELLGRDLKRETFMPDGDATCTYSLLASPASAPETAGPA